MTLKILNCASFSIMILLNYLATAPPINGKNTGELSDQYPNLFVPVGLTFSIWGLIYLLLLIYCVSQFFLKYQLMANSLGSLFTLSCLLNVGWILAWHYELIAVSVVLMFGLLFILIRINKAILVKEETVMKAAFGIYMGWIFIATIANITALLVSIGWNGLVIPPDKWAIAMMTTGALVTIFSIAIFRNIYLAIPVVWAFIGIILKRQQDHSNIVVAGWILNGLWPLLPPIGFLSKNKKEHLKMLILYVNKKAFPAGRLFLNTLKNYPEKSN